MMFSGCHQLFYCDQIQQLHFCSHHVWPPRMISCNPPISQFWSTIFPCSPWQHTLLVALLTHRLLLLSIFYWFPIIVFSISKYRKTSDLSIEKHCQHFFFFSFSFWAKPQLGARNFISVSHLSGTGPSIWTITNCSLGLLARSRIWNRAVETKDGTQDVDTARSDSIWCTTVAVPEPR